MRKLNIRFTSLLVFLTYSFALISHQLKAEEVDVISEFSIQKNIGLKETPVVNITLNISKTRELHVAVQDMSTWKNIKSTRKRIKKSGKYHFELPIENLKPGNYRVNAYIAPRGKDWNDRIGEQSSQNMTVVDADKYVKTIEFNNIDRINSAKWPKEITDNNEHVLNIKYSLTQKRDLHIKLLNSENWKEIAALKFTVNEPGEISLPINNMVNDFAAAKYAWVLYLTAVGDEERISEKLGKNFTLGEVSKK